MQGHITKRGANSYTVIINLGRDPLTGKRRQLWRSIKGTKKDAEALRIQLLHQRDSGVDAPPGKLTVSQYLERWLTDYAEPNLAPKTLRTSIDTVRRHLIPAFGSLPLSKLRPQHIQAHYAQALREGRLDGKGGLSPRSVQRQHQVLHVALRHAVQWQILPLNPADALQPPRGPSAEIRPLGLDEIQRLLTAADDTPYGTLVHLALMTGLRSGELLGLRWADTDLETGAIHVQQVCQWLPRQGFTFRPPKTPKSRRAVALSPDTVDRLRGHRQRQLEARLALGPDYAAHDLVLATPLGTPIDPSNLRRAWKAILRTAGIDHLRFHDLRHAHASLMLQQGTHPKIVSERLGHSGVGITLNLYSHVVPGLQEEAAAGLDRLVGRASG